MRLLPLLFLLSAVGAFAQPDDGGSVPGRPDHRERARPSLSEEYREKEGRQERYPYLQSATPTINTEFGLFLNRNMVVETTQRPQNESSIAINPLAPNVLLSSAVDERGARVYISLDGGRSWRDTTFGNVNSNWRTGNDPSVAFDHEGNGYVMYGAFPGGNPSGQSGVYVAKTSDNGATWLRHLVVIEHKGVMTPDSAFEDKYYIEIDNSPTSPRRGTMYTPWKRVIDRDTSTQIVVARSTDRGLTWSPPVAVSPRKRGTSLDTTFGQSFPITTTGPDGTLYVCWNDGPIRSIGFAKSTDGGLTFTPPSYPVQGYPTLGTTRLNRGSVYHVLKGTFRAETYPTIMADNSNSARRGWLYLAWAAGRNPNIYFARSTDGGGSWSAPKIIHTDTINDQWWPWLSVDETTGDIAVMYSDSRNDPQNILIDTYISLSRDGGDTWIDRRATDFMSDFRDNPYEGIFAGDYSGNAFHAGKVYPSFLDTREDNDVYTALVNTRQPYPVENLAVRGNPGDLTLARLSWDYTKKTETIFGYPISNYSFVVYRNGSQIATLDAATTEYTDPGRAPDSVYTYAVRVAVGADSSIDRSVQYSAAAAMLPLRPTVLEVNAYRPRAEFVVRVPGLRADSTTPLANIRGYRLYRDGALLKEVALTAADTGRTITIADEPAERGYYRYTITIFDGSEPSRESAPTDTIITYAGETTPYTERFDGAAKPRFLYSGAWGTTDAISLSAPNCATDSPGADYMGRRNTAMQIYPVTMNGPVELRYAEIGIVDPGDTAMLEVSYDRGDSWLLLRTTSTQNDPAWADRKADAGDWRQQFITLTHPTPGPTAVAVVRFRLVTGTLTNLDGWYVDDISFGQPAGVGADEGAGRFSARAWPNPARDAAIIEYTLASRAAVSVRVTDVVGREVRRYEPGDQESGRHAVTFDGAGLPAGVYLYEVRAGSETARGRVVLTR